MNTTQIRTILIVLLPSMFLLTTTGDVTPATSPPSPGGCADSVISMSPCLPYISAPPNDLSDEPLSQCCDIFNGAFDSGEADCLCYLVRQTTLLGFPLNATRLLSLSHLCSVNNTTHALDLICSVSPTLPPMVSPTKKPPSSSSGSNARPSPPSPQIPLHCPPPSAITNMKPRPAYNPFGQNATKPSTSEQSNNQNDVELVILIYIYLVFPIIFYHYMATVETTLFF